MYWTGNYVELSITKKNAEIGHHQGPCDDDIRFLRTLPSIQRELNKLDDENVRKELKDYGAWDETELANHNENLNRLLWIACGDIQERSH
jgi:hypothetical protein